MKKLLIVLCLLASHSAFSKSKSIEDSFNEYIKAKDYIGLRVVLRKLMQGHLKREHWALLRQLIMQDVSYVGYDILYAWDRNAPPSVDSKKSLALRRVLDRADELLLKEDYRNAYSYYNHAALFLKKEKASSSSEIRESAEILYPYIIEGMARSLYGLGQYSDSLKVFAWIPSSYPRFRRVLFERMWASIRMGRADYALGDIAGQRSAFFSGYAEPEAYLVQAYVYKMLCRDDELNSVKRELVHFRTALRESRYTWRDWARSDVEGIVLTNILDRKSSELKAAVSEGDRLVERQRVASSLKNAFAQGRQEWLKNIDIALAYTHLSTGSGSSIPQVKKLPDRSRLFNKGLEIWPSDDGEEWIDELGSNVYVGESKCNGNYSGYSRL